MNTGDNIHYTLSTNTGFVFSQTVRGANKELKNKRVDQYTLKCG